LAVFATALVRIMLVIVTLVIRQLEPGFVSWQGDWQYPQEKDEHQPRLFSPRQLQLNNFADWQSEDGGIGQNTDDMVSVPKGIAIGATRMFDSPVPMLPQGHLGRWWQTRIQWSIQWQQTDLRSRAI